ATAGELLIGLKIKELIESGMDKKNIIDTIEEFIKNMKTLFVLENLDNLMKNGRMNKIVVRIATVMQIRPILGSDGEGNIAFFSKAKGTRAAIEKLCQMIGEQCQDTKDRILAITHCNNEEQAMRLKKMAEDMYSFKQIVVTKTRGLASMYANEGGIVVAF
ncbi:MAG: DegV family protein, partial [Oscillospiraceae bacterium]